MNLVKGRITRFFRWSMSLVRGRMTPCSKGDNDPSKSDNDSSKREHYSSERQDDPIKRDPKRNQVLSLSQNVSMKCSYLIQSQM